MKMVDKLTDFLSILFTFILLIIFALPMLIIRLIKGYKREMKFKDISTEEALPLIERAKSDIELQNRATIFFDKLENYLIISSAKDKNERFPWEQVLKCKNFLLSTDFQKEMKEREENEKEYEFPYMFMEIFEENCPICSSKLIWILYRAEGNFSDFLIRRHWFHEGYLSICPDCMHQIKFHGTCHT